MTIEEIPPGIEVIPGWELVRVGTPRDGECFIRTDGAIEPHSARTHTLTALNYVIVRKIKKPKQYRPFANAAEFEPFRDRWVKRSREVGPDRKGCFRVSAYDDRGFWSDGGIVTTYQEAFDEGRQFDDGTPFGIEVTE